MLFFFHWVRPSLSDCALSGLVHDYMIYSDGLYPSLSDIALSGLAYDDMFIEMCDGFHGEVSPFRVALKGRDM